MTERTNWLDQRRKVNFSYFKNPPSIMWTLLTQHTVDFDESSNKDDEFEGGLVSSAADFLRNALLLHNILESTVPLTYLFYYTYILCWNAVITSSSSDLCVVLEHPNTRYHSCLSLSTSQNANYNEKARSRVLALLDVITCSPPRKFAKSCEVMPSYKRQT